MNIETFQPSLNQIAFSVIDIRKTEQWFVEGLNFLPAGGNSTLMNSPVAAKVQGVKGARSYAWWLVGRNSWFQLEMFQFRNPLSKLMPADFRPCDIGYTRMGVHVSDFDAAIDNLAKLGSVPIADIQGELGNRRACVRNPDGVYIEIMEDDPLPQPQGSERSGCPAAVRSVTLSTPDLDASVAYLSAINGHGPEDIQLHTPEHESLWGLDGAQCKRAIFRSGDILVEVVQYTNPVGKPWPKDYQICDQGILNIAYGARTKAEHTDIYERAIAFKATPNWKPFHSGDAGVVYIKDSLGFSVEALWMKPGKLDAKYGFEPVQRDKRPLTDNRNVQASVRINAPVDKVWEVINDHDTMASWCGFDLVELVNEGFDDKNGRGAVRYMKGKLGTIKEQIVYAKPRQTIRYRVVEGAPFNFHRGEITLRDCGSQTELNWFIGFRGKLPLIDYLIRAKLQSHLNDMLVNSLKPFIEK